MNFALAETLEVLERTPAVLEGLLRDGSPSWHRANEGPETWSAFDVVGHLIHGDETNWLPRARMILEGGDRVFEPFDRFAQFARFGEWSLNDLLERFSALRRENLMTVRSWNLTDQHLSLEGRHPELGAVTLRELLATWAVHDLDHIAQIVRVMAKQCAEDVGVWRVYLSILKR